MRKITSEAHNAFRRRVRFKKHNTEVKIINGEAHLYLFDNEIAKTVNGDIWISCGGYPPSVTTGNRLRPFVNLRMHKGLFIVNNKFVWSGKWINISEI